MTHETQETEWRRPATIAEVKDILKADLAKCNEAQLAVFQQYSIEPYLAPIVRYGRLEQAVIVAKKSEYVIYWEDVEEGFNVSPLGPDGAILKPGYDQDELGWALNNLDRLPAKS